MGINAKKQKPDIADVELDEKDKLERDLRSCMKCRFFWGNDSRCIHNKKCGAGKQKADKQQDNKCTGCPYGRNSTYCFPCMRDLLGKKDT